MPDIQEQPLLWLGEFVSRLALLFSCQLLCGALTLGVIRSQLSHSQKLQASLAMIFTLSFLSANIFDAETHLIGNIVGAVAMLFTTPLHAIASIEKAAKEKYEVSSKDVILRVAIPAALPSPRYANEHPFVQVVRGAIYLSLASSSRRYFEASIRVGGCIVDVMALLFMIGGAAGALNVMSAVLGLFGIRSPSPFRRPFLATSLSSFWGGRWNAPISDALRVGLYRPLRRRGVNPALATMACFTCSGLAHELILMYCGIRGSRGEWFAFFAIAGCMTILEKAVEAFLPRRGRWFVSFVVLYIPFHYLFVPVTIRTGLAHAGIEAIAVGNVLSGQLWGYMTSGT